MASLLLQAENEGQPLVSSFPSRLLCTSSNVSSCFCLQGQTWEVPYSRVIFGDILGCRAIIWSPWIPNLYFWWLHVFLQHMSLPVFLCSHPFVVFISNSFLLLLNTVKVKYTKSTNILDDVQVSQPCWNVVTTSQISETCPHLPQSVVFSHVPATPNPQGRTVAPDIAAGLSHWPVSFILPLVWQIR